jgi:hypothetical protein
VSGERRRIVPGGQQFRADDGSADQAVAAALAAYAGGEGSEHAALTALAASRFLVPVVAALGEVGEDGAGKSSEMALPTLIGADGRPAILAFTCVDALSRWRPDARPMPAEAGRVWRAAVAGDDGAARGGGAVVVDVAGPVPFVVEGARLAALAAGQPVPLPHEDPDIHASVREVVAGEPTIAGASLAPGRAPGTDLAVQFIVAPQADGWEPAVRRAAEQISAQLATRLRRGIEISAAARG